MSRRVDTNSRTNKLRAALAERPSRLTHEEVDALADEFGLTPEYTRLVVNGSGRGVGAERVRGVGL